MTGFSFSPPSPFPLPVHVSWEPESQTELSQHAHDKEHLQSLGAYPRPLPRLLTVQLSLQTGQVLFWVLSLGLLGLV